MDHELEQSSIYVGVKIAWAGAEKHELEQSNMSWSRVTGAGA
jgi:hypothetical protein